MMFEFLFFIWMKRLQEADLGQRETTFQSFHLSSTSSRSFFYVAKFLCKLTRFHTFYESRLHHVEEYLCLLENWRVWFQLCRLRTNLVTDKSG